MASIDEFFDKVISVKLPDDRQSVDILDQTLLPGTIKRINLHTKEELWDAIKKLKVRGAPAIGVSAAYGLAVLANRIDASDFDGFYKEFKEIKDYLASSRPTAVNLFWALNRMDDKALSVKDQSLVSIKETLFTEAQKIRDEDVEISRNIGELGFGLLKELKKEGLWFAGADMDGDVMYEKDLKGPIGIVIGAEGRGLSKLVREACDYIVSIPSKGHIDSLNASVAAGVLAYEIVRQRLGTIAEKK